jgi:hypothetical protein
MIASTCCFLIQKFLCNVTHFFTIDLKDILNEHTLKIMTKKNIFINSYLRVLSKSLYLIYQRFEYRHGLEENIYENTELLQALIQTFCTLFNFVPEGSKLRTPSNINKHLVMLNMEIIISILSIWGTLTGFTDSLVYELVYRYFCSINNRPAILFLFGTLMQMFGAEDKAVFTEALKALTSPYAPRRYERKPDMKEKEHTPGPKERKALPLLKFHHHDAFFKDYLNYDQPILDYMLSNCFEYRKGLYESCLMTFFESLFQMAEYKVTKELLAIFERRWRHFFDNRQDYLSDNLEKVRIYDRNINQ